MNKLLKRTIILFTIILLAGCTTVNKTPKINNKNNKDTDIIIKEISNIDKDLTHELPLGIDSVKLMSSGKVILVVTSNNNTPNEELTVSINVKNIYILPFGNGGYRSIIFLKNDGTVSIVNAEALIKDKKIEVLDNVGGYTNVVSIEQEKDIDGSLINVVLESGEKYLLDSYIK